ncbi:zinc finger BED domain-containing protein RICESLEEPER 2-like [Senna tora]|uniref:Zinc finger BED domain-containing protein RICESLEEPER 2-like n=1 Tax=Senna tora TaxID=362788 RepID=A0A834XAG9_9FABA|nr:zinc finger BED domain-containing protein RICESLEEPER 2-like [Senna tora]
MSQSSKSFYCHTENAFNSKSVPLLDKASAARFSDPDTNDLARAGSPAKHMTPVSALIFMDDDVQPLVLALVGRTPFFIARKALLQFTFPFDLLIGQTPVVLLAWGIRRSTALPVFTAFALGGFSRCASVALYRCSGRGAFCPSIRASVSVIPCIISLMVVISTFMVAISTFIPAISFSTLSTLPSILVLTIQGPHRSDTKMIGPCIFSKQNLQNRYDAVIPQNIFSRIIAAILEIKDRNSKISTGIREANHSRSSKIPIPCLASPPRLPLCSPLFDAVRVSYSMVFFLFCPFCLLRMFTWAWAWHLLITLPLSNVDRFGAFGRAEGLEQTGLPVVHAFFMLIDSPKGSFPFIPEELDPPFPVRGKPIGDHDREREGKPKKNRGKGQCIPSSRGPSALEEQQKTSRVVSGPSPTLKKQCWVWVLLKAPPASKRAWVDEGSVALAEIDVLAEAFVNELGPSSTLKEVLEADSYLVVPLPQADYMSWKVKNGYKMYDYYKLSFCSSLGHIPGQSHQSRNNTQTTQEKDDRNSFSMEFDKDIIEESNLENKSEIDQYLFEPHEKMCFQFDIFNWWKVNSTKFLILALIARDILAMPISTVASESGFSTEGREYLILIEIHCLKKTIKAIICAQNWLRSKPLSMEIEECADDIEKIELGGSTCTASGSRKQVLED